MCFMWYVQYQRIFQNNIFHFEWYVGLHFEEVMNLCLGHFKCFFFTFRIRSSDNIVSQEEFIPHQNRSCSLNSAMIERIVFIEYLYLILNYLKIFAVNFTGLGNLFQCITNVCLKMCILLWYIFSHMRNNKFVIF